MNSFVYYIGGPADLTKQVVTSRLHTYDTLKFAILPPFKFSPEEMTNEKFVEIKYAIYEVTQMKENIFVATYMEHEQ